MANVLVLYASFDGQTARIADRICDGLRAAGHPATLLSAEGIGAGREIAGHDAVIIGSAIRFGHHPKYVEILVRDHLQEIRARPNAFFSVCLSARRSPETARKYMDDFEQGTRWYPHDRASFAGALYYRRYGPFLRFMMRIVAGFNGSETDTSRDYEYTDWQAVDRFAAQFAAALRHRAAA